MTSSSSISIIFNPNSTGDSKAGATELEKQLKKALPATKIELIPTKYAGHAEELAYSLSMSRKKPLIISASGDGGYNEVVNGVMRAGKKTNTPVCAVLPTGNANDHSRTMHEEPLWQLIQKGIVTKLDILKVTIKQPSKAQVVRYAHSYVGLGLTPVVAAELNRHTLNAFREMALVLKTFFKYRPFKIRRNNKTITLDSLIFTNINQMAKILTLAEKNKPDDGKFEIVTFPHGHKLLLVRTLLKAATIGLKTSKRANNYQFEVIKKMPMQLDGEVTVLPAGTKVRVGVAGKALSTYV